MMRSACSLASRSSRSRSMTTRSESANAAGSEALISSIWASTSARWMTADDDMGIERAPSMVARSRSSNSSTSLFTVLFPPVGADPPRGGRATVRLPRELPVEPAKDRSGHLARNVAAEAGDLLDQARCDIRPARAGRQEQGLDAAQASVHLRHLQLARQVAAGADPFDDDVDVVGRAVVDQQSLERVDLDVRHAVLGQRLVEHLDTLAHGEYAALRVVDEHGDDHLVEDRR